MIELSVQLLSKTLDGNMSVEQLIEQLQTHLKAMYQRAIDADTKLDHLKKNDQGKFKTLFKEDSGFETNSNRFMPYIEEIALRLESLKNEKESYIELKKVAELMALLGQTLENFRLSLQK